MTKFNEELEWLNSYMCFVLNKNVSDAARYTYVVKAYAHAERAFILNQQLGESHQDRAQLLFTIKQSLQAIILYIIKEKWRKDEIFAYMNLTMEDYINERQLQLKTELSHKEFDASK